MSSANLLSEWSRQTQRRLVCVLKTAPQFTAIRHCVWAGAPGVLCVCSVPCGEIAVTAFSLLSVLVSSGKQVCSVHYPPLPYWEEHHATFTTPNLLRSALTHAWRKSLLFPSCCAFFSYSLLALISVFITLAWLNLTTQKQVSKSKLVLQLAQLKKSVLWKWNIISLWESVLLLNGNYFFTSGSCNQHWYKKGKQEKY